MAKKTEKATNVANVLNLADFVTASVALQSVAVDADGKPEDVMVVTLHKGTLAPEAAKRFQASGGGMFGKVAARGDAAIRSLLDVLKVHPEAYVVPTGGFAFPEIGGNEPKEAETFDELDAEAQGVIRESLTTLAGDVSAYREAESKSRAATRRVALSFAGIMARFPTKKREGIFRDYCKAQAGQAVAEAWPNAGELKAVADLVTSKNAPGELKFFAAIPDSLLELMPEGKNGPKAAQAWVNGLRSELSEGLVQSVKQPAGEGDKPATLTEAFHVAVGDVQAGITEGEAAKAELFRLHVANLPEGGLFDMDAGGKVSPAKAEGGKGYISRALFGSEGSDELLKAFCVAFNGYRTEAEKEADKEARERAKPVSSRDFASLPVAEVALHLFRILAGRIDEASAETLAVSTIDCNAIVALLGDYVEAVATGAATLDDILNPKADAPKSEDDAEAEADAEA
jgi:hypothetical protein